MRIKNSILNFVLPFVVSLTISGCRNSSTSEERGDDNIKTRTPVSVVGISKENISSSVTLNAVSSYLKKSMLKSSASGYIRELTVSIGEHVRSGQVLFTLQTKEAAAYKNLNLKDSALAYTGNINVKANGDGVVTNIPHVAGDYIQEGDELCTIAEQNSLVFLLEVPYELHSFIHIKENCTIILPDEKEVGGKIDSKLSDMDAASQTERYVIKPVSSENIPENLLANISIVKSDKPNAVTLPKEAVLANETQSEYWVMKLVNDSIAAKIIVKVGIQNNNKVEIVSPSFDENDLFISSGSYGLPDSAIVTIMK